MFKITIVLFEYLLQLFKTQSIFLEILLVLLLHVSYIKLLIFFFFFK